MENKPSSEAVPENANEHCPGVESQNAGKSSSCAGCPNQSLCASGGMKNGINQTAVETEQIKEAMKSIKRKFLVLSGKGGVGKSTVSSQLALTMALCEKDSVPQVGVLDVDLCGPSIPTMFGLEGYQLHQSNLGWTPAYYEDNLAVVSIGFMLPNKDDAVIWRGPKKNGLIKQFLRDVYWGDYLDYLIIDTPPGTSDEHITIVQYLKNVDIDGAIIVTTPQDVSCNDVRREINFCKKVGIPIIGIIENMSGFVCPNCKNKAMIFKPTSGGGQQLAIDYEIPFLGSIPLDPMVMQSCETGKSIVKDHPESPASQAMKEIVQKIITHKKNNQ
ncbi:MRP-like mind family ATPase [Naegleria gruberi]|uniref:Cytosolic Fe-S cluster assembly factor NUBP1 homolog n=1 Tax=Naegleria gruberi TaxID=5762 RepID=D2UY55_NAEGR|nr:MRP-like mind family ATPase [Naegleria gruberi]EFC50417.1 MRP-like mind family ATPase [Naegleria gruberi]|eukprot:XP_002683161.1 MRP-like mind family ATPase [Naegleria gruberi strain NEG-M]